MSDKLPTIDIKGKEYVTVDTRVAEFHKRYPEGSIDTQLVSDPVSNRVIVKAIAYPVSGEIRSFTGYAQELIGDGFINKTSALENCETSAVGRALGFLNIGLVGSIATADEVFKAQAAAKRLDSKDMNKPTMAQRQEMISLLKQLDIKPPSPDDNEEWTNYCLVKIGVPSPLNQDQIKQLISAMQEDILDAEQKRATDSD